MRLRWLLPLVVSTAPAFAQVSSADSGVVVGIVTAAGTTAPLPFADVTVEGLGRGTFADSLGRFRIAGLPLGNARLRARRLGFAPVTANVVVAAAAADTLRISLTPVSLRLQAVRTRAARVCGGARDADTVVVAILDQVRANAERSRLLAREYPFEATIERTIGDRTGRREAVHRVDTLTRLGGDEREWKYEPGTLVRRAVDSTWGAVEHMMIPELADFADDVFIRAHCFQFAGLERINGQELVRLTFEPARSVNGPDVSGSLYLSPDGYQLRRSTLRLERVAPSVSGYLQVTEVESTFREVVPFVPVLENLGSTTTARSFSGRRPDRVPFERQRLLDLRFLREVPSPMPIVSALSRPATP
jgi:hypothetical protein